MRPLNLATQPFRNERLPAVLLSVAAVVVLVFTVAHAVVLRNLLPGRTSAARQELAALEAESVRLRSEARAPRPAGGSAEWGLIKDLVDRRAFSWTLLFAHLESVQPFGVRLISIAPQLRKGEVLLDITAVSRNPEDTREFVRRLAGREEFDDVYLREEAEAGQVRYTMKYKPTGKLPPPSPSPSPAASPEESPAEGSLAQ
jgi:hypothetical protein